MSLSKSAIIQVVRVPNSLVFKRKFGTTNDSATSVSKRYPPSCQKIRDVQVFGDVWQKFKAVGFKRYQDAPLHGVRTQASYFDTGDLIRGSFGNNIASIPTAVLIHGSPGSVDHFSTLIDSMTEKGIRVICPSLLHPDFTFNTCKYYRHSAPEKADYIKAIMQEEGVKKIDCLVSHSSGTFVNMELNQDPHVPDIKSVALFHVIGDETPGVMKPYWFIRGSIKMSQNTFLRKTVLEGISLPVLKAMGNPFARKGLGEALWGGFSLHYYDRLRVFEGLRKISQQKKPCVIVIADNDAVLSKNMNQRLMTRAFDFDVDTEADIYDADFQLERAGQSKEHNRHLQVIRCRTGGHFAFLKHDSVVNPAVIRLIQSVQTINTASMNEDEEEELFANPFRRYQRDP